MSRAAFPLIVPSVALGTGAPGRQPLLDGLRGYFLVFMTLMHVGFDGGAWIQKLSHASLGFVEDAQGFVFLSGLVLGMAQLRSLQREGIGALWRKAGRRMREIYLVILKVLLLLTLLAAVLPGAGHYWGDYLGGMAQAPLAHLGAALSLAYQPALLDILPQYLVYLAVAPLLLLLVQRGHARQVLALSAALWAAVQAGWLAPLTAALESLVIHVLPPVGAGELRSYFHPLAWQLLFVSGLVIGTQLAEGRFEAERWFGPGRGAWAAAAAVLVLMFMLLKLSFDHGLLDEAARHTLAEQLRRPALGPIYVCNFAATAYLLGWLLHQPRWRPSSTAARIGDALRWLLTRRFFIRLGRHSLQVCAWHVLVAYALVAAQWYLGPFTEPVKAALALLAIGSLILPVWWRERHQIPQTGDRQGTLTVLSR